VWGMRSIRARTRMPGERRRRVSWFDVDAWDCQGDDGVCYVAVGGGEWSWGKEIRRCTVQFGLSQP
jgi:hypothetical protein